jgi:hypothetical protein
VPYGGTDMPGGRGPGAPQQRQRPRGQHPLDHPRTVYLREADLLPPPGRLAHGLFDPANEVERFRVVLA